jgi:hypothetical protein
MAFKYLVSGVRGEVFSDGFHIYEYAVSQDVDRFA